MYVAHRAWYVSMIMRIRNAIYYYYYYYYYLAVKSNYYFQKLFGLQTKFRTLSSRFCRFGLGLARKDRSSFSEVQAFIPLLKIIANYYSKSGMSV